MKLISPALHRKLYNQLQPERADVSPLIARFGLRDTVDNSTDIELPLPAWVTTAKGTLEKASEFIASDVYELLQDVCGWETPTTPNNYPLVSGWFKLTLEAGQWVGVGCEAPCNSTLVIDTEAVDIDGTTTPVCFCGYDGSSWFIWLNSYQNLSALIPDGTNNLYIAHNANYDRALLASSYCLGKAVNKFYCTMSAVTSVRGMSNQQLIMYNSQTEFEFAGWETEATKVGLASALKFYTDEELDKSTRASIWTEGLPLWVSNTAEILKYCCVDVASTVTLAGYVIPEQFNSLPSITSLAGQVLVGNEKLFLTPDWMSYYGRVEEVFKDSLNLISDTLRELIDITEPNCFNSFLDWGVDRKGKTVWKKKLLAKAKKAGVKGISINWRESIAMLCLTYHKHPITWFDGCWCYAPGINIEPGDSLDFQLNESELVALPHPERKKGKLVKLIIKCTVDWFEGSIVALTGNTSNIIKALVSVTNWESMRGRVADVEFKHLIDGKVIEHSVPETTPNLTTLHIPAGDVCYGTVSGRKGSKLWLVVPNPKAAKIGTEIKSYITAPTDEYKLVVCDFDSQEAVIFAALGDSKYGISGYTPISVTVNLGDKDNGTDIHSLQAKAVGISRETAKELVYAAFYGQGVNNASAVISRGNISLPDSTALSLAKKFHVNLKGYKQYGGKKLAGGMASDSYNAISDISDSQNPRTPFLKRRIPMSLNTSDFKTTRDNWVVQSTGRDLLDAFITLISYGIECEQIDAYLSYTCHDEVIFVCHESQTGKLAKIVFIAHLLTYACFTEALGLDSLMSCRKYPELVDVDTVWRKTTDSPCKTPTNFRLFSDGESYNIDDIADMS